MMLIPDWLVFIVALCKNVELFMEAHQFRSTD